MKKRIFVALMILFVVALACACSERGKSAVITFKTGGGTSVAACEKSVDRFPMSARDGYAIEGWYSDNLFVNRVKFPYTAKEDTTLYAKWTDMKKGSAIEYEKNADETGYIALACRELSFSVVVPDEFMGLPVVGIVKYFVKNSAYMNRIYIGKNVTDIKEEFYRYPALSRIFITGDNARYSVKNDALFDKENNEIVAYPRGLEGENFYFDGKLGRFAIIYNSRIKTVQMGKNATAPVGAFSEMSALQKFEVDGENPDYATDNGVLFSKDKTVLYKYPQKKTEKSYSLPSETLKVEDKAFEGCLLESIKINAKLNKYDDFSKNSKLTEFTVESGNTAYKAVNGVLYGYDGKTLVRYPCGRTGGYEVEEGTEKIYPMAFANAGELTDVKLPKSLKNVANMAFMDCTKMEEVVFEEESEIKVLDGGAFIGCKNLTRVVMTARTPPETGIDVFEAAKKEDFVIVVPENAGAIYAYYWNFCSNKMSVTGKNLTTYGIIFVTNGAEEIPHFFGTFLKNEPIPQLEGREFLGWFDNEQLLGNRVEFPYIVDRTVTLYAFWGFDENGSLEP